MEIFYIYHLMVMMLFSQKKKKLHNLSDMELIDQYKVEQEPYIIGILYERYSHLVLGVGLNHLKNYQDAEDISMRVFIDLDKKLLKHSIQHFKSWLYQVTKNECLMELRKKKIPMKSTDEVQLEDENEEPELKVQLEKRINQLEEALQDLKPLQKKCVEAFYLNDKSYQEISIEFELPLNQVKSAIQNGKRNLKIWIESHE